MSIIQHSCRTGLRLFLVLPCLAAAAEPDAGVLRVGIYDNPPKIYSDDLGNPSGFWPRLIAAISERAGFAVVYVPCEWSDCLQSLEDGRIDVMPDVAHTDDRSERFRFGRFPVLYSWSEIYHKPDMPLTAFSDLAGRSISVMEDSSQHREMQEALASRDIAAELVLSESLLSTIELVARGDADVAVVNRFIGEHRARELGLISSGIVVEPGALFFAYAPGVPLSVVDRFDTITARLRENADSEYYRALTSLLTPAGVREPVIPAWVWWALTAAVATLLLTASAILVLRRLVARRTAELSNSRFEYQALASSLLTDRESERKSIARDIHDDLGQELTALKLDVANLLAKLDPAAEIEPARDRLDGQVSRAIASIRRIASDLRPPLLDDFGLDAAIEALAEDFARRTGIDCDVDVKDTTDFPIGEDDATQVFRIVQEALTNVARHSQASRVSIRSHCHDSEFELAVIDDGQGIDSGRKGGREGLGILGMRERAALRGWRLSIGPADTGGTAVRLRITAAGDRPEGTASHTAG